MSCSRPSWVIWVEKNWIVAASGRPISFENLINVYNQLVSHAHRVGEKAAKRPRISGASSNSGERRRRRATAMGDGDGRWRRQDQVRKRKHADNKTRSRTGGRSGRSRSFAVLRPVDALQSNAAGLAAGTCAEGPASQAERRRGSERKRLSEREASPMGRRSRASPCESEQWEPSYGLVRAARAGIFRAQQACAFVCPFVRARACFVLSPSLVRASARPSARSCRAGAKSEIISDPPLSGPCAAAKVPVSRYFSTSAPAQAASWQGIRTTVSTGHAPSCASGRRASAWIKRAAGGRAGCC